MSFWVIIPVKPLRRSKSKLNKILSEDERTDLNLRLFENTLKILKNVETPHQVLVVSKDSSVISLSRTYKIRTLQEDSLSNLNLSLKKAAQVVKAYSAKSILILPADLPFLNKDDITNMVFENSDQPTMVISPDRKMSGTNLMMISPPDLIEFSYGPGSFERHIRQAQLLNAKIVVKISESSKFDIDSPEDYEIYKKLLNYEN